MRYFFFLLIILFPDFVFASCFSEGVTVVYVNGVSTTQDDAQKDLKKISEFYKKETGDREVVFLNGYNSSHLNSYGDKIKAFWQDGFSEGAVWMDFDLETILLELHGGLKTQKVLLVGHSQGSYYTNQMYTYLTTHGVSKESVAVFNVATPARFVSGGGGHLNSTEDSLLNSLEMTGLFKPLYRNISLPKITEENVGAFLDDVTGEWPGHSFGRSYLAIAPASVVAGVSAGLAKLSTNNMEKVECFMPPKTGLKRKIMEQVYTGADNLALKVAEDGGKLASATVATAQQAGAIAGAGYKLVASAFESIVAAVVPKGRTANLPGSHDLVGAIYGSSVTEQDLDELLGSAQSGAVVLASRAQSTKEVVQTPAEKIAGEVKGEEKEKLVTPLIPPPSAEALAWPGFGGGAQPSSGVISQGSSPVVPLPDGVPPSLLSLSANGFPLQSSYASLLSAPLATSGTLWRVRMEFDENLSVAPQVFDSPSNSLPRTSHIVDDCGDTDARTFCFDYSATPNIQANTPSHLDQWVFDVSRGADVSGEVMASTIYSFAIDTLAPAVTAGAAGKNALLPIVDGLVSQDNAVVQVLVNGHFFTTTATANYWFVQLSAGQELSEGYFAVQASSTDAVGNWGPAVTWQILVDLISPTVQFSPAIADGDLISSTTPSIAVVVADNNTGVTHACEIDSALSNNCTGVDVSGLSAGPHTFKVVATDVGGNQTTLSRSFTVLP